MYLDNNPDYQTVWQLAHNWAGVDPEKTDANVLPPKFREHLIRLIIAIRNKAITARTRKRVIFIDNSVTSKIADIPHYLKTLNCLLEDKINKAYLDSLYVKREEVIDLCVKSYCDLPPCWIPKNLTDDQIAGKEARKYRPEHETEDKIRCQAIAVTLWELEPAIHPAHMVRTKIMQLIGNGKLYDDDTIKGWIAEDDPRKEERKSGRPPKTKYKINLEIIPQSKK